MGSPFSSSYSGPYRVLLREKKILLLQLGDGQEWVSVDRLCLGGKCANRYKNKVSLLLALHVSTSIFNKLVIL